MKVRGGFLLMSFMGLSLVSLACAQDVLTAYEKVA